MVFLQDVTSSIFTFFSSLEIESMLKHVFVVVVVGKRKEKKRKRKGHKESKDIREGGFASENNSRRDDSGSNFKGNFRV